MGGIWKVSQQRTRQCYCLGMEKLALALIAVSILGLCLPIGSVEQGVYPLIGSMHFRFALLLCLLFGIGLLAIDWYRQRKKSSPKAETEIQRIRRYALYAIGAFIVAASIFFWPCTFLGVSDKCLVQHFPPGSPAVDLEHYLLRTGFKREDTSYMPSNFYYFRQQLGLHPYTMVVSFWSENGEVRRLSIPPFIVQYDGSYTTSGD